MKKQVKKKDNGITFSQLADIFLAHKELAGKYSSFLADRSRINHFRNFLPNGDIAFSKITELLLKKYITYLKVERENKDRSVINNLIIIRTIFNLAIREEIVDRKHYPFGNGRIRIKLPQSVKIGLTTVEVRRMEELDLEAGSQTFHARNIWLISFYFAGMRVSDVLRMKWSDFIDDRLYYTMGKNQKAGSLKIPEKALTIIKQYETDNDSPDDFIFPYLKSANKDSPRDITRKMNTAVKQLNKYLKRVANMAGIDKKVTMHIARHTFVNISGDLIPIQMLQKLYRHTSITTTINYQSNFIFKDTDEALDSVIKT